MAGLCGWYSPASDAGSEQRIGRMTRALARYDQAVATAATGAHWSMGAATVGVGFEIFSGESVAAMIHGDPEILSAELRLAADRAGLSAAIADRYRQVGVALLSELGGSFSLAIILQREKRVLLAIDRTGIQSMFFAAENGGVAFASALPALISGSAVSHDADMQAVFNYLYFHAIPSPDSIYQGVSKLLPGHYAEFRDGKCVSAPYWTITFSNETGRIPFRDAKTEFLEIIAADIRRYADRGDSIGCFLSGGTDSSTVAGMVGKVTGKPARTYSIGFAEQGFDEMEYALIAARAFHTDHHEYYVTAKDVVDLVPRIATAYGQPFGNSSAVPAYFCADMARRDGVQVMLAGDGGDELFGGNKRYAIQELFALYEKVPASLRSDLLEPLFFGFPKGESIFPIRKVRRYIEQANMPMPARLGNYNLMTLIGMDTMFDRDWLASIDPGKPIEYMSDVYHRANALTMMNRMLALDIKFTLADNDLPKVNEMCQMAGMKVGYPLLSDALVNFSAGLPANQKVRRFKLRYFFKKALEDFLPREIIKKKKHGFGLPIGRWLVSYPPLRDLAFDSLTSFKSRGIMRGEFIDELVDRKLREHPDYYGTLVWVVMILEHWYADKQRD